MLTTMGSIALLLGLALVGDDAPKSPPAKDPELRTELLRRTATDQQVHNEWVKWMKDHGSGGMVTTANLSDQEKGEFEKLTGRMKAVDEENTKWLKGLIEKQGWPTSTLAGKDGANAAWLLVQHADADPKFQRQCLDLMAKLPKDEVSQSNFAYLTDRVLLAEGKKQIYGSQFTFAEGKWQPRPLEDEANVDKRRTEAGLPPLAEYAKLIEQQYGSGQPR
jgi:hypothetical protein